MGAYLSHLTLTLRAIRITDTSILCDEVVPGPDLDAPFLHPLFGECGQITLPE